MQRATHTDMDHVRDSGICVDNTDDIELNSSDVTLTVVRKLAKRFESLSHEQQQFHHAERNWWLTKEERELGERQKWEMTERRKRESGHLESEQKRKSTPKPPNRPPPPPPVESESADIRSLNTVDWEDSGMSEATTEIEEDFESEKFDDTNDMAAWMPRITPTSSRPTSSHSNKLRNIVRELLDNEENYVKTLQLGIHNYLEKMDSEILPRKLMGQKFHIFGNIENIFEFHRDEFLPRLVECEEDVEKIADTFTAFIQGDAFYGYVLYAINSKRSEILCKQSIAFFNQMQERCGDKLGVNSFLLQPIQRLPRYKLLLDEIIKELYSELPNTSAKVTSCMKNKIAAVCKAEKNVQRLAVTINESICINDIKNCNEINIYTQGKFRRLGEFDIQDNDLRRRYKGKFFFFEKCSVYTEVIEENVLEYRGHYMHNKFGMLWREGKSKFKLFEKRSGYKEIELHSDIVTIHEWATMVQGVLMNYVAEEKEKLKNLTCKRNPDSTRSSISSHQSDLSYRISSTSVASAGSSSARFSQWYI